MKQQIICYLSVPHAMVAVRVIRTLLLYVALFVMLLCLPTTPLTAMPITTTAATVVVPTSVYHHLRDVVQQRGSVRVVVALHTTLPPNVPATATAADDVQRQIAIAAAQRSFQHDLAAQLRYAHHNADADAVLVDATLFRYIPYVAIEADSTTLNAIATNNHVAMIWEDAPLVSTLNESAPLVGATVAHEWLVTGSGWTVAVLDSGIEANHPLLANHVVDEACYSTVTYSGFPAGSVTSLCPSGDDAHIGAGAGAPCNNNITNCQHGTHVAGIIASIAPDATLLSIQVQTQLNHQSLCQAITHYDAPCIVVFTSDEMRGLERVYELRHRYRIAAINLSLGRSLYTSEEQCDADVPEKAIIHLLADAGIVTIAAAGNDSNTHALNAPACISRVVSVGSTDDGSGTTTTDRVSYFSNSASFLDVLAPGQWITSAVPNAGYATLAGTSMATPHVAAAWALITSRHPTATIDDITTLLKTTGVPVTDYRTGSVIPRLHIDAALRAVDAAPFAPTNLVVAKSTTHNIALTWHDASYDEQGFRIFRTTNTTNSDNDDVWQLIATLPPNETYYTDTTIVCGTTYLYRVAGYKYSHQSAYSNHVTVTSVACLRLGDCNGDRVIDAGDLAALAQARAAPTQALGSCDVNDDGVLDIHDVDCTARRIFAMSCDAVALPLASDSTTSTVSFYEPPYEEPPSMPITPTVSIVGLATPLPNTTYIYTATIAPLPYVIPITTTHAYTWEPPPLAGQHTAWARYRWAMPGPNTISVSATVLVSGTNTITNTNGDLAQQQLVASRVISVANMVPPYAVIIDGLQQGSIGTDYTFYATLPQTYTTLPLVYEWQPPPIAGQHTPQASYRWLEQGIKTVSLTVSNRAGVAYQHHTITITIMPYNTTVALTLPQWQPAHANDVVDIPLTLVSDRQPVTSLAATIQYDPQQLLFDPDDDHAVQINTLSDDFYPIVLQDSDVCRGRIALAVSDPIAPLSLLPNGIVVATLRFRTRNTAQEPTLAPISFALGGGVSVGNNQGASIAVAASDGSVRMAAAADTPQVVLPPCAVANPQGFVTVPLMLSPNRAQVQRMRVQLVYDERFVHIATTNSNGDSIVDAIQGTTNTSIATAVIERNTETHQGTLTLTLQAVANNAASNTSEATLPAGDIAHIRFVVERPTEIAHHMVVRVAEPPTFTTHDGTHITGSINGGVGAGTHIMMARVSVPVIRAP